jgi:tetratricopeptide (TPR) repeat protein
LIVLGCFLAFLGGESVFFARQFVSAVLRQTGEQAFFANDHRAAWGRYESALRWGGDPEQIEIDEIELLLFGLDQVEGGTRIDLPLPPPEALRKARALAARRLSASPYKAYYWSLASDIYMHAARQSKRDRVLDLATLSEDPIENLAQEEWQGLAALELATRWEPMNHSYHDFLAEFFLELGSPALAASHCRRAVAALPRLDDHPYLSRPSPAPEVLAAALQGFEEAAGRQSMVLKAEILCETSRLLIQNGQDAEALSYLERAIDMAPGSFLAQYLAGQATYRLEKYAQAVEHFQAAARLDSREAWPHYFLGRSLAELGRLDAAVAEMRLAREAAPAEVPFLHGLGEVLERAGREREAERQFVAAANLHPKDAGAWAALLAYQERNASGATAEVCATLLRLNPGDRAARQRCGHSEEQSP